MPKCVSQLLFLALAAALLSAGCGEAAPSPQDLIPKTDLPSGMVFNASDEETIGDYAPSGLGYTLPPVIEENATSSSLAKYHYGTPGAAYYVLVVKCKDGAGAEKVLEAYSSVTFGEGEFEVNEVSFNDHDAVEGYAASTSDYVYFWQNKEFVFGVVGSSREATLELAEATGY